MTNKLLVLNLEDSRLDAELNQLTLEEEGIPCEFVRVDTKENFQAALDNERFDIILADFTLPSFNGVSALVMARKICPDIPFIFVTGTLGEEVAIDALKRGATDYLLKTRLARLAPAVKRALLEKAEKIARKKAEEDLRIKNQAIESSINGIAIFDRQGHISYVNPAFLNMWGYGDDHEILGKSLLDYLHQPDANMDILSLLDEQGYWLGELPAKRKNQDTFIVQVSATEVWNELGESTCLMASFMDISEHKKMEERLRQSQKLEAIGTLANGIAHDFNNILGAIFGYTEMALTAISQKDPLYKDFQQILKAANRARDLIKQILTFSRQNKAERGPLRISLILKENLKLLRASLPTTIEIAQNISADAGQATVLADPTELQQIILNLGSNAAYAMREKGGVLSIALKCIKADAQYLTPYPELAPGPYLLLSVADTGNGMTEEIKQRIFEPYFTTKSFGEGTGLGLATVYGIVKGCQGGISVTSEPGHGAKFEILLPLILTDTDKDEHTALHTATPLPCGQGSILLVDDEETILDTGRQMLEYLGYRVVTKKDSLDALIAFRSNSDGFDLIILDQMMPKMTGTGLAQEILAVRPELPIILCSGHDENIDRKLAKEIGIQAILLKPIAMRELAEILSSLLKQPALLQT